jgi:hypothetical protein
MAAPLNPQEIYLQERYISVDYFGQMRDAWAQMVAHSERCLDIFMHNLPPDYRSRDGVYQPDIVWGERVLVNFRDTLRALNAAFIQRTHGDFDAIGTAHGVLNDFRGFSGEYSAEWMDEPQVARVVPNAFQKLYDLLGEATQRASNIAATWGVQWTIGDLTHAYASSRGPLNPPNEWPTYRVNHSVRAQSGKACPRTGIYLPDANDAPAAFFIEGKEVWNANVGLDESGQQRDHDEPCSWTLVERVSDTGGGIPGADDPVLAGIRLRALAGEPCPREGFWVTPAKTNSRRHFKAGELMPDVGGDYGATIWQWDEKQG